MTAYATVTVHRSRHHTRPSRLEVGRQSREGKERKRDRDKDRERELMFLPDDGQAKERLEGVARRKK